VLDYRRAEDISAALKQARHDVEVEREHKKVAAADKVVRQYDAK